MCSGFEQLPAEILDSVFQYLDDDVGERGRGQLLGLRLLSRNWNLYIRCRYLHRIRIDFELGMPGCDRRFDHRDGDVPRMMEAVLNDGVFCGLVTHIQIAAKNVVGCKVVDMSRLSGSDELRKQLRILCDRPIWDRRSEWPVRRDLVYRNIDKERHYEEWLGAVLAGQPDACCGFLLAMFPNVVSIDIDGWPCLGPVIGKSAKSQFHDATFIGRVMRGSANSQRLDKELRDATGLGPRDDTDAGGVGVLRYLTRVGVRAVPYRSLTPADLLPFLMPPLVETAVVSGRWDWYAGGRSGLKLELKTLVLVNPVVGRRAFRALVKCCTLLSKVQVDYRDESGCMIGVQENDVEGVLRTVCGGVGDVVRSIHVPFFGGSSVDMRSMRQVEDVVVTVFRMGSSGVAWRLPENMRTLTIVLLPDSVSSVYLWRWSQVAIMSRIFSTLGPDGYGFCSSGVGGGRKLGALRYLREVRFVLCREHLDELAEDGWVEQIDGFVRDCAVVGVEVVFGELSWKQYQMDIGYGLWPVGDDWVVGGVGGGRVVV